MGKMGEQFDGYETTIDRIREWYISAIRDSATIAGGITLLSEQIGCDRSFLSVTLKRKNFGALREALRRILKKGGAR